MDAAVPVKGLAPAEATQAAPISAIDAECVGRALPSTMSAILRATAFPIMAEGIPVRGGVGEIGVPFGLNRGREMGWGGANAIPAAKRFEYAGDW